MTHITKQLLINSLIKLPVELVDIIKDFTFLDKIQQNSKNQKDITLHYLIQCSNAVYEYQGEYLYLYASQIKSCYCCGNFKMNDNIYQNYPINIKCKCDRECEEEYYNIMINIQEQIWVNEELSK
jgi:hypothetical protein